MQTFISQITDFILTQKTPPHQWVIVVPSQRSIRYIQKSLYEKVQKPLLSPKIISINAFFEAVSPRFVLDKTRLLFQLYNIYYENSSAENKSFDEFYNWGKILLSDFDEIDRYLIESKQLFKNLRDIKEIENWSFNSEQLTEAQLKFIKFWEELGVYYLKFNERLKKANQTYNGNAVREIASEIKLITQEYPNEHFLFCGFNAHSPAELSVIKQLLKLGVADVLFDADRYYIDNKFHEAGTFIRQNLEVLDIPKSVVSFKDELKNKTLDVKLIPCAQSTGQVKVAATILEKMSKEEINQTLILLADENLLVPLLKNIPANVGQANITLGLSLNNSILKTWIELIFKTQKGLTKTASAYHKDVFNILYHPFIEAILTDDEKLDVMNFELIAKIRNTIYLNPRKMNLSPKLMAIFELIYTNWENDWSAGIRIIRKINRLIYGALQAAKNDYEKALLETFDAGIIDLQNCVEEGIPSMSLATFKNVFTQHYASLSIAYFGNPIEGLQIMGLLETRMLDFKRIICIGMNEKNMPPNNQINSLIPMDLRSYFGMPTVREKQGIFAHHFYRLLHEVEALFITYSTNAEGLNSSEKSRYILQLELELSKANPNISFHYSDYTLNNEQVLVREPQIEITDFVQNLVRDYLTSHVSASAIRAFYTCSLDFFYKYILKFNDEIKIEEDVEASTFGSLIHKTLENFYQPFANQLLQEKKETLKRFHVEQIDEFKKRGDVELRKCYEEFFHSDEAFSSGKNRLVYEMAYRLLENFFDYEKKRLTLLQTPFYIEATERTLRCEIPDITLASGEKVTVKLKGIIDRIDFDGTKFHIIDYKSGKVEYDKFRISKFSEDAVYSACCKKKYFIQFYFYLYLFYKNFHDLPGSVTFVSFVNLNKVESITNADNYFEQLVEIFPKVLQRIVSDITDPNEPFQHKDNGIFSYCEYCN